MQRVLDSPRRSELVPPSIVALPVLGCNRINALTRRHFVRSITFLPAEHRLDSADYDTEHGKAENSVLYPGSC
jgi:hypothetical protein